MSEGESLLTWTGAGVKLPCSLSDLPTPALIVDEDVVIRNCEAMISKAKAAGVKLRPHMKTHKTIEIGKMQVREEAAGIMASTLPEVKLFAESGFKDITYGVPVAAAKLKPLCEIARASGAQINVMVDNPQQVEWAAELFATQSKGEGGSKSIVLGAFMKIDSGYHRAGVDIFKDRPAAIDLARALHNSSALTFLGVYSHSGHSYNARTREAVVKINDDECEAAAAFAKELEAAGIPCPTISVGSTPTCGAAAAFPGVTEIHPGNYVFFDRQQSGTGACSHGDIAVTVLSRVIGHYNDHFLCDAGSLAMSKDSAPQDGGFGTVQGRPDLLLAAVSQESGKIVATGTGSADGNLKVGAKRARPPEADLPLGSLVRILPNHSCLTAACHPLYYILRGDKIVDVWRPCRGF